MQAFLFGVVAVWFGQGQPDPGRSTPLRTAGALVVTVGDAAGGAFIADAEVRLPTLGRTARTGWNGEARFGGLSDGEYRIQVRALGYAPGDFDARVTGDTVAVHFAMERIGAVLDTVRVSDTKPSLRLAEFERRRSMGIGRFLTDSMLADDKTRSLQYVLATRFPGFSVKEKGIISTQPSGLMGDNECPVLIYLDGMQLESVGRKPLTLAGPQIGRGARPPPPDPNERRIANLDIIRPDELTGVEVYSRTTAPQEYRPLGNYCKVVLLWTRFRRSPDKK
jgi:hypothetical protein